MNYEDYKWDGITYGGAYIKALFDYVKEHPFKNGLEVGFDQGASALAFLRAAPDCHLMSVDIVECPLGKQRVTSSDTDTTVRSFVDRLTLYTADSRQFLVGLKHQGKKFDFIYIDGDHLYDAARQDLFNADELLTEDGYMIVDDANPNHQHFGVGKAVAELCAERKYDKWDLVGSPSEAVVLRRAK